MRVLVCLLGVVTSVGMLYVAVTGKEAIRGDFQILEGKIDNYRVGLGTIEGVPSAKTYTAEELAAQKANLQGQVDAYRATHNGFLLYAPSAVLGLLAALLGLGGKGKTASILFLVATAVPAVFLYGYIVDRLVPDIQNLWMEAGINAGPLVGGVLCFLFALLIRPSQPKKKKTKAKDEESFDEE